VSLESIRDAAERLAGVARRTPLLPVEEGPGGYAGAIRLKCESLQRGGSFKLRGAYNFISRLPDARRSRGVVTYSSGNHGRAVALAARILALPAVVVVPVDAPRVKVEGIRRLGAEVVAEGTTSVQRQRRALAIAEARGLEVVPPFDDPRIIAGQGTVGLEIAEDWPDVERVVVPIGGGGLISGVAAALTALRPSVRVYGVQAEGAASMRKSLDAGRPVELESVDTIADGLKPVRPGDLTFQHVRSLVVDVVTVSDAAIVESMLWCAYECKLLVEPSGAAALAALSHPAIAGTREGTAVVLSGGNLDPAVLADGAGPGATT
jgi:threonine dehydratase